MDDDFNTPGGLAAFIRVVELAEEEARNPGRDFSKTIIAVLEDLGSILGVLETEIVGQDRVSELVGFVLDLRSQLRDKCDFASCV